MNQKKHNLFCTYSNTTDFVLGILIKVFIPITLINIFYFQYQYHQESKEKYFQGNIFLSYPKLSYASGIQNISLSNNSKTFSISIVFIFPNFRNKEEISEFKICLKSWKAVFPQSEIYTCFNQNGIQFYNEFINNLQNEEEEFRKIKQLPKIESDELGIIYIDDLFNKIYQVIKTDILCLIKSTAILPLEVREKIFFLSTFFSIKNQQFSAIGKRCALKLQLKNAEFNRSHLNSYLQSFYSRDLLRNINFIDNSIYSNDFIILSLKNNKLNIDDIPSFYFGMDRYDTWIPGWMDEQIPVVSLGDECSSYNIGSFHGYEYLSKLAENFEIAKFRGDKYKIASKLTIKIEDRKLINDTSIIAFY
ncbi:hypothetical protein M9Y10_001045 [Tritrichomonas musculus]|uniref:Uncharacterized protein n=1 Tax=Tritrichomonas musculus TaxID=1915356 RepID=A0ABR2GJP2_9EUKA